MGGAVTRAAASQALLRWFAAPLVRGSGLRLAARGSRLAARGSRLAGMHTARIAGDHDRYVISAGQRPLVSGPWSSGRHSPLLGRSRQRRQCSHTDPIHLSIWTIRAFRACYCRGCGHLQDRGSFSMAGHGERSTMFTVRLNAKVLSLPGTLPPPIYQLFRIRTIGSCLIGPESSTASDGFEP